MPISFNEVPSQIRVPFAYIEFDNSKANQGLSIQPYKALLIGQKTSSGTATALTPENITSKEQAAELFGSGSQLFHMAEGFFANNDIIELDAVALDDPGSSVAATGSFAITGTATASGTLSTYIGGKKTSVLVSSGDTASEVATALAAAISADTTLSVSASASTGTVTVTAKNKGLVGNQIDLRTNYAKEDKVPAGLSVSISAMSSGSGTPDLSLLWAAMGDTHYNIMVAPFTDSNSITAFKAELEDRNGPLRQIDAMLFMAEVGSFSELTTLGESINSQFISLTSTQKSPTLPYYYSAAIAAQAANAASIDPARPFQTLKLSGVLAPQESDKYTLEERNLHLYDGIATTYVSAGNDVLIERLITSYRQNALGANDPSYLDVNTLLTLSYLRYDFRNYFLNKYPRVKLANDGTRYGSGQAIMTPKLGKAEAIARFRLWEEQGLVEGAEQFKDQLIVERNSQDPNRLDFLMPTDLVNQLRITGVQFQFLL